MGCLQSSAVVHDVTETVIDYGVETNTVNKPIKILFFATTSPGKSTMIKNLIHTDYRHHCIATEMVNDSFGTDIGPIIMSFLSPPFRCEDLQQCRHVIRQNCVSGILKLLKKSQELYESDPIANGPCLVTLGDWECEVVIAIQLVVTYGNELFDDELDYEELERLGLCCRMFYTCTCREKRVSVYFAYLVECD